MSPTSGRSVGKLSLSQHGFVTFSIMLTVAWHDSSEIHLVSVVLKVNPGTHGQINEFDSKP